jgi:hypothetical protein
MALGLYGFDAGNIHYKGHWKGWTLKKIATVLGPNGTLFAHCHFRAQKSLDFQDTPLTTTFVLDVACIEIIMPRAI